MLMHTNSGTNYVSIYEFHSFFIFNRMFDIYIPWEINIAWGMAVSVCLCVCVFIFDYFFIIPSFPNWNDFLFIMKITNAF